MPALSETVWDLRMACYTGTYFVGFVAISAPVEGVLTRWRAQYSPNIVQLKSGEGNGNTKRITNVFKIMKQVYKVEGIAGLYKGMMPDLIISVSSLAVGLLASAVHLDSSSVIQYGSHHIQAPFLYQSYKVSISILRILLITLPSLPLSILTVRAITTPLVLPFHKPLLSLRLLLTPHERRRPWVFYTPALILTHVIPLGFLLEFTSCFLEPLPPLCAVRSPDLWWRGLLAAAALVTGLATIPVLEMIRTRLSVQRNFGDEGHAILLATEGEKEVVAEYPEKVIELRQEPYAGLVDCAKKIVQEEGWKTLYRLWWTNTALMFTLAAPVGIAIGMSA